MRKLGRPYKPPAEKLHRIEGWVPALLWEWIRENGGSRFIRHLLQKAYEQR